MGLVVNESNELYGREWKSKDCAKYRRKTFELVENMKYYLNIDLYGHKNNMHNEVKLDRGR